MIRRRTLVITGSLSGILGTMGWCGAQTDSPTTIQVKPPPVPTGIVPLPQGAPPTNLQAPLPAPALPAPNAAHPLLLSPTQEQLSALVDNRAISINDAVAIALATSRPYATAVEALLRAQGRTGEARAALGPTLGIGAQLTEFDAPTTANFAAFGGGGAGTGTTAPAAPFVLVNQFNPVLTASATLPLDITGTLGAAVSQAQFQEVAARIDINRARNQIVLDVKNAFYNVLRAQAQTRVAQDNLNNAINRFNNAQKNYAAGTSPRFDVITTTSDVATAQQALIQAKSQVSLNLALLKSAIGIDIRTRLRVTDQGAVETPPNVAPPAEPAPAQPTTPVNPNGNGQTPIETPGPMLAPTISPAQAVPTDPTGKPLTQPASTGEVDDPLQLGPEFDAALHEALATRPEILEADAQIAAARKGVQYARRSSLPSLALSLGYTVSPNAAGFTRFNEASATLGVNIPIFDAGLARSRVREAQADVATAQTNRRNAIDQVSVEVQQAYLTLLQARDRVAVANVGLTQAREAARLAQVRYNAGVSQQTGVSPILELSNAQNSLTQAENNQVNALYDYNNARAALDRAIGRYSYVKQGPGYSAPPSPKTTGNSDAPRPH